MSKLWIGDKVYIVDEEVQAEVDRLDAQLQAVTEERDRLWVALQYYADVAVDTIRIDMHENEDINAVMDIGKVAREALNPDIKQT